LRAVQVRFAIYVDVKREPQTRGGDCNFTPAPADPGDKQWGLCRPKRVASIDNMCPHVRWETNYEYVGQYFGGQQHGMDLVDGH
jgi:hypothetical protein